MLNIAKFLTAVLFIASNLVAPAETDEIEARLVESKNQYDSAIEKVRLSLLEALTKKNTAATKAGELKSVEAVQSEIESLKQTGKMPQSIPTKGFESQVKLARTRLETAFAEAIRDYTKEGKIDLAKAVQQELDEFKKVSAFASAVAFFNGKDLSGWRGLPALWARRDGSIVGSTKPDGIKFNTCLVSDKQYGDFELKCKVKLSGPETANSGIQIRSQVVDARQFKVEGAQCDIGQVYWGSLHGEGTGMMQQADKDVVAKVVKKGDFNELHIHCVGRRVCIKLNGETTVDKEFLELPARGFIGWQLHSGKGFEVVIKDIEFKELPSR